MGGPKLVCVDPIIKASEGLRFSDTKRLKLQKTAKITLLEQNIAFPISAVACVFVASLALASSSFLICPDAKDKEQFVFRASVGTVATVAVLQSVHTIICHGRALDVAKAVIKEGKNKENPQEMVASMRKAHIAYSEELKRRLGSAVVSAIMSNEIPNYISYIPCLEEMA